MLSIAQENQRPKSDYRSSVSQLFAFCLHSINGVNPQGRTCLLSPSSLVRGTLAAHLLGRLGATSQCVQSPSAFSHHTNIHQQKGGSLQRTSPACSCVGEVRTEEPDPCPTFPHPSPLLQAPFVQGCALCLPGQAPTAKAGNIAGKTLIVHSLTQEPGTTKGLWGSSGKVGFFNADFSIEPIYYCGKRLTEATYGHYWARTSITLSAVAH